MNEAQEVAPKTGKVHQLELVVVPQVLEHLDLD